MIAGSVAVIAGTGISASILAVSPLITLIDTGRRDIDTEGGLLPAQDLWIQETEGIKDIGQSEGRGLDMDPHLVREEAQVGTLRRVVLAGIAALDQSTAETRRIVDRALRKEREARAKEVRKSMERKMGE